MNSAIPGLVLNASKGTLGFRVVGNDRNACPHHYGVFLDAAYAERYAVEVNEDAFQAGLEGVAVKVVRFKVR